jgi:hypothetical protein
MLKYSKSLFQRVSLSLSTSSFTLAACRLITLSCKVGANEVLVEVKKTGAFRASLFLIIFPTLIRGDKEFAAQTYAPI